MHKHIDSLYIHKFRSLEDKYFERLGHFNLLVGSNNCGKTSVLESIAICCRPNDPFEWVGITNRRDLSPSRRISLESLKWIFPHKLVQANAPKWVGCDITGDFPVRSVSGHLEEIKAFVSLDLNEFEDEQFGGSSYGEKIQHGASLQLKSEYVTASGRKRKESRYLFWQNQPFIQPAGKPTSSVPTLTVKTVSPHSHKLEDQQYVQLSNVAFIENGLDSVLELLKLFDDQIMSIKILALQKDKPEIFLEHESKGLCPISTFGDGLRRALALAICLEECSSGVLLIDELEVSIHTSLLAKVLKWFSISASRKNVQIFATTHSLEAIDAVLDTSFADDLVVFRLAQNASLKRFDSEQAKSIRFDLGAELRW